MTRATEREIAHVEWVDSCSENTGWTRYSDLKPDQKFGPARAVTVGFVVAETEEALSLSPNGVVHDYDEEGDDDAFDFVMTIPKVAITNRRTLCP